MPEYSTFKKCGIYKNGTDLNCILSTNHALFNMFSSAQDLDFWSEKKILNNVWYKRFVWIYYSQDAE